MFTGIVEEVGFLKSIDRNESSYSFRIGANKVLENTQIGDSIATNGVCLTVTSMTEDSYRADIMAESLRASNLGSLKIDDPVNLERALSLSKPLGGHLVSGHIDGVGKIRAIDKEKNAIWYEIEADRKILKYIIKRGSIALDGISLTVAELGKNSFKVSIIPHTREQTNLYKKKVGDGINIEVDMVGKYIEKFLNFEKKEEEGSVIDLDFLSQNGFL